MKNITHFIIAFTLLFFSIDSVANQSIYDQYNIKKIAFKHPLDDYFTKFYDTFVNARMYFYFKDRTPPSSLCKLPQPYNCEEPYDLNKFEGDFKIKNKVTENGQILFEIEIEKKRFFVNATTLITNFDFMNFFELPSYRMDNITDQIKAYAQRLKGKKFYKDNPVLNFYVCENNTLSVYDCPEGIRFDDTRIDNITVLSVNEEDLSMQLLIPQLSNQPLTINQMSFFTMLTGFMIKREQF